jgi:hypothetical protein
MNPALASGLRLRGKFHEHHFSDLVGEVFKGVSVPMVKLIHHRVFE